MPLPTEIVERILMNCDGKTLLAARNVCLLWHEIVEYISKKTPIWQWCCMKEIPEKELITYLNNFRKPDHDVWFNLYKTWLSFQDMREISFETILSPVEIPRITCIDVSEGFIAVGSEDGRVRIFTQSWKLLCMSRYQAEKVSKVTFLYSGIDSNKVKIVIAYSKSLIIHDPFDSSNTLAIEDVLAHSIYKDYICYQKQGGRLTIERLNIAHRNERCLVEVWFTRIYSPSNITCINMWNGVCTILINNHVRKVNYGTGNIVPISSLFKKLMLNYSMPNSMTSYVQQILRDDIIVVLYRSDHVDQMEYMEVIMLGPENGYSKKLFNTSEVLKASINCICLYGNTMVLGVDTGIVYFYHIPSWKHFSIKDYQRKIIIGKHPITNIVVRETKDARRFYITSSFDIHEVVGFSASFF